jgi:Na+(H+)/acetate symporter ActP
MKGITFVQAFQYWVKAFAIAVPLFVIMSVYGGYTSTVSKIASNASGFPVLSSDGNYKINGKAKAPTNVVAFQAVEADVTFKTATVIGKVSPSRKPEVGEDDLVLDGIIKAGPVSAGTSVHLMPIIVTKGGVPVEKDGKAVVTGVKLEFDEPAELSLMSGLPVPNAQRNSKWLAPFGTLTSKHGYPLLYTYSLIIALICGTAGLPHILVRFYTNPDGRSAKKTTFWVMVLIGVFYFFTPIWGAVGREFIPGLYIPNKTDYVVINLPGQIPGVWGDVLKGVTSAGAFAAFMSTFSGLLVSMSGAWAHDIFGRILKPQSSPIERITAFKFAAIVIGVISMVLGLFIETFDIAMLVGWAFAIAAASYFPLLLLGAWWRGLTATGAASGMLVGGMASLTAIIVFMLSERKVLVVADPLLKSLCEQPAIWAVPLSLGVMYVVSMATKTSIPSDVDEKMLRLHAPEGLGYSKDYIASDH